MLTNDGKLVRLLDVGVMFPLAFSICGNNVVQAAHANTRYSSLSLRTEYLLSRVTKRRRENKRPLRISLFAVYSITLSLCMGAMFEGLNFLCPDSISLFGSVRGTCH